MDDEDIRIRCHNAGHLRFAKDNDKGSGESRSPSEDHQHRSHQTNASKTPGRPEPPQITYASIDELADLFRKNGIDFTASELKRDFHVLHDAEVLRLRDQNKPAKYYQISALAHSLATRDIHVRALSDDLQVARLKDGKFVAV